MKIYGRYLFIPLIYGIIFSIYGTFHTTGPLPLLELVIDMGFGEIVSCSLKASAAILESYVPYLVFVILFSTYIYRHFCNSSVYYFSRCENRKKWFGIEMLRLFAYGVLYVSILAIGRMLPGVLLGRLLIDWKGILLLLYLIVLLSLWLFEMTLFGNIISIVCGSYIGVSLTCGLQILAVLSLAWIDVDHLKGAEIQKLIWNQNAYLILGWNRFPGYDSELFRNIKYSLSPQYGCFYFIGIIGIIIAAGLFMIQRIDLLDNNKED